MNLSAIAACGQRNSVVIDKLLTRQINTSNYDAALCNIYEAKSMLVDLNRKFLNSKSKVTIEIEPVGLHLLEDLMHDLHGESKNFIGTLKFENGTIIVRTK